MRKILTSLAFTLLASSFPLDLIANPPEIRRNPVSRGVRGGTNITLRVETAGTLPLSYQWQLNGTNLGGATESSLTITNFLIENVGAYQVVLSNQFGMKTSFPAKLFLSGDLITIFRSDRLEYSEVHQPRLIGSNVSSFFKIAGADHPVYLTDDGVLYENGNFHSFPDAVAIAGSHDHTLILNQDGTVTNRGDYYYDDREPVFVPGGLSNVVAIAANDSLDAALKADGTVVVWGSTSALPLNPPNLSNVVAITANLANYMYAVKADGEVVALSGHTHVPIGLTNVASLSGGGANMLALKKDGTVMAWQWWYDKPAKLPLSFTNIVALQAANGYSDPEMHAALTRNGSIVLWCAGDCQEKTYIIPLEFSFPRRFKGITAFTIDGQEFYALMHAPYMPEPPRSRSISLGTNVVFSATTINPDSINYQWQFEGSDILGATNSAFAITNVQTSNLGTYTVISRNAGGATWKESAILREKPKRTSGTLIQWTSIDGRREAPSRILATNVTFVSAKGYRWYALTDSGTIIGEFPYGSPSNLSNLVQVSAGSHHGIGVKDDGTIAPWDFYLDLKVVQLPYLRNVAAVSAGWGWHHNMVLFDDGEITAWGDNSKGEVNIPSEATDIIAIEAGHDGSYAIRKDGRLLSWGWNSAPMEITNAIAVSAQLNHAVALKDDGTIANWGETNSHQSFSNIIAVAAGQQSWGLALKRDGLPVTWGNPYEGSPDPFGVPSRLTGVTAIAAGIEGFAITTQPFIGLSEVPYDSLVWIGENVHFPASATATTSVQYQWKFNGVNIPGATNASLNFPFPQPHQNGTYTLVAMDMNGESISYDAELKVRSDSVVSWGNRVLPPDEVLDATAIAAGNLFHIVLRRDGTVRADGAEAPAVPVGLSNVIAIAAGHSHGLALRSDRTVVAWGSNSYGQTNVPSGLSDVISISANGDHNLALKSDGTVVAWGRNDRGQTNVPSGLAYVMSLAAGHDHSVAVKQDGTVVVWGESQAATGLSNVVAVAAANRFNLALLNNKTLTAWGIDYSHRRNIPGNLTNVTAISMGEYQAMALKEDGTVTTWGCNCSGVTNSPSHLAGVIAISAGYLHSATITARPAITFLSAATNTIEGERLSLNISAMSPVPFAYQWQFNGTNILGATNSSLTISSTRVTDSGQYTVVVSNQHTSVISEPISLIVNPVLLNVEHAADDILLSWSASITNFALQESTNLSFASWTNLTTNAISDGGFFRVRLPLEAERKFFRLNRQ